MAVVVVVRRVEAKKHNQSIEAAMVKPTVYTAGNCHTENREKGMI